jgi:hypothetical protein
MQESGLGCGGSLGGKGSGEKSTLTPKTILDRELDQALSEIEQGKTYGPFNSAKSLVRSLNRETRKLKKKSA